MRITVIIVSLFAIGCALIGYDAGMSAEKELYNKVNNLGFAVVNRVGDTDNYIAMDIKTGYAYMINISKQGITVNGAALDGAGKHIKYEFEDGKK